MTQQGFELNLIAKIMYSVTCNVFWLMPCFWQKHREVFYTTPALMCLENYRNFLQLPPKYSFCKVTGKTKEEQLQGYGSTKRAKLRMPWKIFALSFPEEQWDVRCRVSIRQKTQVISLQGCYVWLQFGSILAIKCCKNHSQGRFIALFLYFSNTTLETNSLLNFDFPCNIQYCILTELLDNPTSNKYDIFGNESNTKVLFQAYFLYRLYFSFPSIIFHLILCLNYRYYAAAHFKRQHSDYYYFYVYECDR